MESQSEFIDLRILIVKPDTGYNMLQIVLEQFEFNRITTVPNYESTLDQLCFNSFDLMIICDNLPTETISSFAQNIKCGALNNELDMAILSLAESGQAAPTSSTKLLQHLRQAFTRAEAVKAASAISNSRTARLEQSQQAAG